MVTCDKPMSAKEMRFVRCETSILSLAMGPWKAIISPAMPGSIATIPLDSTTSEPPPVKSIASPVPVMATIDPAPMLTESLLPLMYWGNTPGPTVIVASDVSKIELPVYAGTGLTKLRGTAVAEMLMTLPVPGEVPGPCTDTADGPKTSEI